MARPTDKNKSIVPNVSTLIVFILVDSDFKTSL